MSSRSTYDEDLKSYIGEWKSKPKMVKNRFLNLKANSSTSNSVENVTIATEPSSSSSLPTTPVSPVGNFQLMSRLTGESLFSPSNLNQRQRANSLCSPDDLLFRRQSWNRIDQQQQQQQQQQHKQQQQQLLKTANLCGDEKSIVPSSLSSNDILKVGSRKRSISFTGNSADFYD